MQLTATWSDSVGTCVNKSNSSKVTCTVRFCRLSRLPVWYLVECSFVQSTAMTTSNCIGSGCSASCSTTVASLGLLCCLLLSHVALMWFEVVFLARPTRSCVPSLRPRPHQQERNHNHRAVPQARSQQLQSKRTCTQASL